MQGTIDRIIVAHKDRLARYPAGDYVYGFDLFEWFCNQYDCKILVLNQTNLSPEAEMVEDILAILHCFSSRLYGLRKYKPQIEKDPDLPKYGIETTLE